MMSTYSIGENDKFCALRYPDVTSEIEGLQKSLVAFDSAYKAEIVISMLRDHSIKTEWLTDNKQLAKVLASGSLATSHIESLFNSCRHNMKFTTGLARHITDQFSPAGV